MIGIAQKRWTTHNKTSVFQQSEFQEKIQARLEFLTKNFYACYDFSQYWTQVDGTLFREAQLRRLLFCSMGKWVISSIDLTYKRRNYRRPTLEHLITVQHLPNSILFDLERRTILCCLKLLVSIWMLNMWMEWLNLIWPDIMENW